MKLTIIETGLAPAAIRADWPDYPTMFAELLHPHMPDLEFETVALSQGAPLPDPATLDAILITGSAAGVYDDPPWMQPLFTFIRDAATAHTPQIGICFGHQALAYALGAEVNKSDKGWGIGRHTYDIAYRPDWMGGYSDPTVSLGVSHQDQVQSLAPGAKLVVASDFTPFAAIDYPSAPAMSFQGHPEFSAEFSCALFDVRNGTVFPDHQVKSACDSLNAPIDNAKVGAWMARFLQLSESCAER